MVDYIAVQEPKVDLIDELSKGLARGAKMSHISITGGEIAQMRDVIAGDRPSYGFDLAATAVGSVDLDKIIVGKDLQAGDVIIGIPSSGVHSNGLTLARKVFFKDRHFALDWSVPRSDKNLGQELLEPTYIYVDEIVALFDRQIEVHGLAHITSDGFLNLPRLDAQVGYDIDELPEIPPIFRAIQDVGDVPDEEMYSVYNMGIGFCVIAPEHSAERVLGVLKEHGRNAQPIGHVTADGERHVHIRPANLVGQGKHFQKA
jgi:phosphoribosylformylglycinamidine cyclo-ligase